MLYLWLFILIVLNAVWLVEHSRGVRPEQSLQRAVSAGVGEFLGIVSKFLIGVAIWLTIAVAAFSSL